MSGNRQRAPYIPDTKSQTKVPILLTLSSFSTGSEICRIAECHVSQGGRKVSRRIGRSVSRGCCRKVQSNVPSSSLVMRPSRIHIENSSNELSEKKVEMIFIKKAKILAKMGTTTEAFLS